MRTIRSRVARRSDGVSTHELRLRQTWTAVATGLLLLATLAAVQALLRPEPLTVTIVGLVALVALAVLFHRRAVRDLELGRQQESETFSRILRGLSRSVSPDAIVEAIVEDLGEVAAADHTVVVRLQPEGRLLEATLVSSRAGVPSSTTLLPASDLDDPGEHGVRTEAEPLAIPITPDRPAMPVARGGTRGGGARRGGEHGRGDSSANEPAAGTAAVGVMAPRVRAEATRPFAAPSVDSDAADRIAGRIATRVGAVYGLRNTIAAPLRVDGAVVGAIVLSRRIADGWSEATVRLLRDAAGEASAALARAYSHRAAEARASTDGLTGLPNRRYFDEFCALLARRRRADDAVGVLMVDVDHFKQLNDRFGHPVGDVVLKSVADAIAHAVREEDVPARYGGEEFVVLLRNPSPAIALEVGERIRAAVAALDLRAIGPEKVTVSVGVAMARTAGQPISELVDQADNALYRAKRLGRDRVVAA